MTGISSYSTTASENVQSNTGIDWDEGMSPAQVNNSARQNMADIRAQWNDGSWFQYGNGSKTVAHAYASSTSTTIATDVTGYYHAGRRIRAVGSSTGTIYGNVASSSYSAPNTTINYTWDSGSLSNEALTIYASTIPVTGHPVGPAPTRQVFLSGTSQTYTTPANCRQLRIRMVGGGGGGAHNSGGGGSSGSGGGTTTFNSVTAIGGGAGSTNGNPGAGGSGGSGSPTGIIRLAGGGGGAGMSVNSTVITANNGGTGGNSAFGGGACGLNLTAGATNTGGGGAGGGASGFGSAGNSGGGGGAGEYVEFLINSPAATYTYSVATGGAGGTGGTAGAGGSGIIIVDEIY